MTTMFERTKTTVRHEYVVPSPAALSDFQLAIHLGLKAREAAGLSNNYDDALRIESDDEHVIVFWEEVSK